MASGLFIGNSRRRFMTPPIKQQETICPSPFGTFELARYPRENDPTLRAWSAADDYLLQFTRDELPAPLEPGRLLIANDAFGALSICLHSFRPTLWSDSFISRKALEHNLKRNRQQVAEDSIRFLPSVEPLPAPVDCALMQLPKSHSYLRFQLERIAAALQPGGLVVAGVMVKHFHPNVLRHFEEVIGETHTTLARKKARLIVAKHTRPATGNCKPLTDYASRYPLDVSGHAGSAELLTLPNVFSFEKLDIGTRALLPHIPTDPSLESILDLGCGNGALGIQGAQQNPGATITFCDESWLAVTSARLSAEQAGVADRCDFLVTDALQDAPKNQNLILCNPPFHQQNSMHKEIALRMFRQARQHLAEGGRLLVVANRHLNYHQPLRKLFAQVELIHQNSKFVIIEAR